MKTLMTRRFAGGALGLFFVLTLLVACGAPTEEKADEEENESQKPSAEESVVPWSRGPTESPSISGPKTKPPQ